MANSAADTKSISTVWLWLPVVLWAATMFTFSSSLFTASNTSRIIAPILHWLIPGATAAAVGLGEFLVRKAAHFTEYCVLFWLLIRGPMARRPYVAFAICVVYAALDETHQIFVPGRSPSPYDVALDSTGALFGRYLSALVSEIF
jgi:VanZ family protein